MHFGGFQCWGIVFDERKLDFFESKLEFCSRTRAKCIAEQTSPTWWVWPASSANPLSPCLEYTALNLPTPCPPAHLKYCFLQEAFLDFLDGMRGLFLGSYSPQASLSPTICFFVFLTYLDPSLVPDPQEISISHFDLS